MKLFIPFNTFSFADNSFNDVIRKFESSHKLVRNDASKPIYTGHIRIPFRYSMRIAIKFALEDKIDHTIVRSSANILKLQFVLGVLKLWKNGLIVLFRLYILYFQVFFSSLIANVRLIFEVKDDLNHP